MQRPGRLGRPQRGRAGEAGGQVEHKVGAALDDLAAQRLVGVGRVGVELVQDEEDEAEDEEDGGGGQDGHVDLLLQVEGGRDEAADVVERDLVAVIVAGGFLVVGVGVVVAGGLDKVGEQVDG